MAATTADRLEATMAHIRRSAEPPDRESLVLLDRLFTYYLSLLQSAPLWARTFLIEV